MLRILFATYASPESFLDHLRLDDGNALLAVSTKANFADDEEAILEIGYPGLPNRILIRSHAAAAPDADDERKWFRIDDTEELQLDFLIAIASGKADASVKRRHRRFPLRMDAQIKIEGEGGMDAQTADVHTGGLALETEEAVPDGTRVSVVLSTGEGSEEIEIAGTVVWNRHDDGENAEIGIEFERTGGEDMKRLRQLIREVKLSGEMRSKG
jgi:Tfp pilus assembly protein PilZ